MVDVYICGSVSAPFSLLQSKPLIDAFSGSQCVLPANYIVRRTYFHVTTPLSNTSTWSVGWAGNTDALVPVTATLTSALLNSSDNAYGSGGLTTSQSINQNLVVTSTLAVTTGNMEVVVECVPFVNIYPQ
jgi:hypothetical protein